MKNTLERLVSLGKNIGKSIQRSAKIGLFGLALASPFILANKAEASEGWILVDYKIGSFHTNGNWALTHYGDAEEGLDQYDNSYFPLFGSSGVNSKITSFVEGKELETDQRPEFSTSSANFSYDVITEGGGPVPDIDNPYLSISTNGFDEEDVSITVDGTTYDAKTVSTIPLSSLSGSGSVSFSLSNGGEDPDPNDPVVEPAPGRLKVDNIHDHFLATTFDLVYTNGAIDGEDSQDVEYKALNEIPPPVVVSRVGDKYFEVDSRGTNSEAPVYLVNALFSDYEGRINTGRDSNTLVFSFPKESEQFGDRLITFQEYLPSEEDSNIPDPNAGTFPIYDVKALIEDGEGFGAVVLPNFERRIYAGTLHDFVIRTDKESLVDYTNDGRVDLRDYSAWARDFGKVGDSQSDLASVDPNGIMYVGTRPDGRVDYHDLIAFSNLYNSSTNTDDGFAGPDENGVWRE